MTGETIGGALVLITQIALLVLHYGESTWLDINWADLPWWIVWFPLLITIIIVVIFLVILFAVAVAEVW
jgi:hypothetical protein